jgi:hypothetical protein
VEISVYHGSYIRHQSQVTVTDDSAEVNVAEGRLANHRVVASVHNPKAPEIVIILGVEPWQ